MANASVLLIEVDPAYLGPLESIFASHGLTVHTVGEGHAALRLAEEVSPDLIVLAVELPTINGYIVCKSFKKNERFANVPLFLLSSGATARDFKLHQRLRIRADEYFLKPFTPEELWATAREHLGLGPVSIPPEGEMLVAPDSSLDQQLGDAFADIFDEPSQASMSSDALFLSVDASLDAAGEPSIAELEELEELEELPELSADGLALEDVASLEGVDALGALEDVASLDGVDGLDALEDVADLDEVALIADFSPPEDLQGEVARLRAELASRDEALKALEEGELARLKETLAARDAQITQMQLQLTEARKQSTKTPELEQAQARCSELEQHIEAERRNWEQERKSMVEEQKRLSDLVRELEEQSDSRQHELATVRARLATLETQNTSLRSDLETARAAQASRAADLKESEAAANQRIAQLEAQQQEQAKLLEDSKAAQEQLARRLEASRASHQRQVESLQGAILAAQSAHTAALGNLSELKTYASSLESRLSLVGQAFGHLSESLTELATQAKETQPEAPPAPALQPIPTFELPELDVAEDNAEEDNAMVVSAEDIVSEEAERFPPAAPEGPPPSLDEMVVMTEPEAVTVFSATDDANGATAADLLDDLEALGDDDTAIVDMDAADPDGLPSLEEVAEIEILDEERQSLEERLELFATPSEEEERVADNN